MVHKHMQLQFQVIWHSNYGEFQGKKENYILLYTHTGTLTQKPQKIKHVINKKYNFEKILIT